MILIIIVEAISKQRVICCAATHLYAIGNPVPNITSKNNFGTKIVVWYRYCGVVAGTTPQLTVPATILVNGQSPRLRTEYMQMADDLWADLEGIPVLIHAWTK